MPSDHPRSIHRRPAAFWGCRPRHCPLSCTKQGGRPFPSSPRKPGLDLFWVSHRCGVILVRRGVAVLVLWTPAWLLLPPARRGADEVSLIHQFLLRPKSCHQCVIVVGLGRIYFVDGVPAPRTRRRLKTTAGYLRPRARPRRPCPGVMSEPELIRWLIMRSSLFGCPAVGTGPQPLLSVSHPRSRLQLAPHPGQQAEGLWELRLVPGR